MVEQEVTKELMESLKTLAETNMKISKAREELSALKELEVSYLDERDEKSRKRFQVILDESADLLEEVKSNYAETTDLLNTASSFSEFLSEAYKTFTSVVEKFNEKQKAWDQSISQIEGEFEQVKKQIKSDKVRIKNDQSSLEAKKRGLDLVELRLKDERETLDRAIKRLKEGRI